MTAESDSKDFWDNRAKWDRKYAAEVRRVREELDEPLRVAEEFDLPLPAEPTRMVGGVIIHATVGPGYTRWKPSSR